MRHVLTASAIAASALVLCAACGSSTTSGDPGASTTPIATGGSASASAGAGASATAGGGVATTGAVATSATTGSGSGSGSGANAGLSTCLPRYLNASTANEQGAAGSDYVDIVFKNLNTQACTLSGYPGVSFGAGTPVAQVGQPASRNAAVSPSTVTLQPGGSAYAVLQIGDAANYPASSCQPTATTYLQVIAPNTTNTLYAAFKSTACKGNVVTLHVEAVQAGTGA
jgi:hypothetical protein